MTARAVPRVAPLGSTHDSIDETPVAPAPQPAPPSDATAEPSVAAAEPPAAPATPGSEVVANLIPSSVASAPAADALDFTSLVTRLRKTKAINLVTKVAVKNQSDDLLEAFRAYHKRHGTATLADLRRSYDSLFHKLHSLLQDADPPLDREIHRSRAVLWEILSDPSKFSASSLMAGA
jgi:hypothetical protein